jgi:hypothetical protein
MLLGAKCIQGGWQFRRDFDGVVIQESPSGQLGPKRKVQVFGQGRRVPTAPIHNCFFPPDASGAVEVEKVAPQKSGLVLHGKMNVQECGLGAGQPVFMSIQMGPAGLHHPHLGIGEMGEHSLEQIGRRDKIRIEDGDEIPLCLCGGLGKGAGFESLPHHPPHHPDVHAQGAMLGHPLVHGRRGVVGGIVQDLDFQEVGRMIQLGHSVDETEGHFAFVEDGQLNGDPGVGFGRGRGQGTGRGALFRKTSQQKEAMKAKERQHHHAEGVGHGDDGHEAATAKAISRSKIGEISSRLCS